MKLSVETLLAPVTPVEVGNVYPAEAHHTGYWLVVATLQGTPHCVGFNLDGASAAVAVMNADVLGARPTLGRVDLSTIKLTPTTAATSTEAPEQEDTGYRVLNLVELKILAHHGYIAEPVDTPLSRSQEAAYRHLICKRLIESTGDQDGYTVTPRGRAHLDAIQHLALPEAL